MNILQILENKKKKKEFKLVKKIMSKYPRRVPIIVDCKKEIIWIRRNI